MAVITGTAGSDKLTGTNSSDVFTGREGDDVIVYTRGPGSQTDVVTDFGTQYFAGAIDASQEVPTNGSGAVGVFSGALRRGGGAFDFQSVVTGMDFGGAQTPSTADNVVGGHFHRGGFNINGPIVFGFVGGPNNDTDGETRIIGGTGTVSGQWDAGEGNATTLTAELALLRSGGLYINYHTTAFPGGEVRGQILPVDFGRDRIDVSALGIGDFATVQALLSDVGGSARLATRFGGETTVLDFQNLRAADLTASDFIFAGLSDDVVVGTAREDDLFGGAGNDTLSGLDGSDRLFGGIGGDTLIGGLGDDLLLGGAGDDLMGGGEGRDNILGGAGADFVGGEAGDDIINGEDGADKLFGDAGADLIGGGEGADGLFGGDGDDFMGGENGDDFLDGGQGVDVLFGDAGNDVILGGAGADRLFGQDGADNLHGREGDDFIDGGAGVDTAVFSGNRATYTIVTNGGVTTVTGADGTDTLIAVERLQFADANVGLSGSTADDDAGGAGPSLIELLV